MEQNLEFLGGKMMEENPIVFMSYSHDSEEHKEWVKSLATRLRGHGVDVILDQWDLHIGQDLRFFMEQGITKSKMVLCVCSENYVNKSNSGIGGVGYESVIISQNLLSNVKLEYIIPIIRNNNLDKKTPICLGTKSYIDFNDDINFFENYRILLERIYNEDEKKKPALGKNPFANVLNDEIIVKKSIDETKYCSPEDSGIVTFEYDNNNHKYVIGTGNYQFITKWSSASNDCIYAYGDIGYIGGRKEFPTYNEIMEFDFSSHVRTVYNNEIVVFKNKHGKILAIKLLSVDSRSHGKEKDVMTFEYKIIKECI